MNLRRVAILIALGGVVVPGPAAALTCSLSAVNTIDFGSVSPLDSASSDVSAPFTVTCYAPKSEIPGAVGTTRVVNLCMSYDNGTAGASGGGNRQLANGGNNALFDLYPTGAYGPTHAGNRTGAPPGVIGQGQIILTKQTGGGANTAAVATTLTAFGRLFGGQNLLPPALYTSTLTLTVDAFWNDTKSDCAAGGAVESAPTAAQLARVEYVNECRVGTISTLDFGATGFLTSNLDAATSATVTCTNGTPFKVGLNAGNGAGATTSVRKMTRTSAPLGTVDYGLYSDPGRSVNWGNDTGAGTDTQNGTGAGTVSNYPIYGRVPPQDTPEAGDYLDVIVLSVVF